MLHLATNSSEASSEILSASYLTSRQLAGVALLPSVGGARLMSLSEVLGLLVEPGGRSISNSSSAGYHGWDFQTV